MKTDALAASDPCRAQMSVTSGFAKPVAPTPYSTPALTSRHGQRVTALLSFAVLFCGAMVAQAAPHLPQNDDVVLDQLPPAFLAQRKLRGGITGDEASPNLADALTNAKRFIEVGQTYADPRAYGYAQAALGKWWSADPATPELLVMRARILQFRHEFNPALAQLETSLDADQFNPDAWLLFASIAQVQGNVPAARKACLKLIPIADPLIGATCVASVAALGGHEDQAGSLLSKTLRDASGASASERTWAWTTLAEIYERSGDMAAAENAFRQALQVSPDEVYARAAYADLLLDQNRAAEVPAVLRDPFQADALLLRAAIAAQVNDGKNAAELRDNLGQRFAEAKARGDDSHLREQARFALDVEHDPVHALDLAQRNFLVQQEPADARILLAAATAADNPKAAQPAIAWLQRTGIHAPLLLQSANALGKPR
jgi:tetratricopeptide (TPR) repeat protein